MYCALSVVVLAGVHYGNVRLVVDAGHTMLYVHRVAVLLSCAMYYVVCATVCV